jgi:nucleoside-diphosphate-sugar epimerase
VKQTISILGCGWLGKALALEMIRTGNVVYGSTTQEAKLEELASLGIKPFLIDLQQPWDANAAIFFKTDTLVICVPPKIKSGGTENYIRQMEKVHDLMQSYHVARVIFVSSSSVYPDLGRIVTEEDADRQSPLVRAEDFFLLREWQSVVVRFTGLVGPGRHPGRFLAEKKNLPGKNSPVNIIHQQDCVDIIKAIINGDIWNEVFNACADLHPSRSEFYTAAAQQLGLEPPQFDDHDQGSFKIVSAEKLKRSLHYQFRYPDPLGMLA